MNELRMKQCPFCGRYVMLGPDADPRDVCGCDGAKKYQLSRNIYKNRLNALEKLCGEDCGKINAEYQPVGEETYDLLKRIVYGVCFRQLGKTQIALPDGTALTISESGVKRSVKIVAELAQ